MSSKSGSDKAVSKWYNLNVRRFDRELARELKVLAAKADRTLSGVVEEACREWIRKREVAK